MEPSLKKYLVPLSSLVVVVLLSVLLYIFLTSGQYQSYKLVSTPYRQESFAQIQGNNIYSYNGLGFYKQDITTGKVSILSQGVRLPAIEELHWGDEEGVLVTFGDGNLEQSILEQELKSRGLRWGDETRSFIWYLDFRAASLTLVSRFPFNSDNIYFSSANKSYYYSRQSAVPGDSEDFTVNIPILRYDTATKKEFVVMPNTKTVQVGYVGPCINASTLCYTTYSDASETLYVIKNSRSERVFADTYKNIFPTSNPAVFIGTREGSFTEGEVKLVDTYFIDLPSKRSVRLQTPVISSESLLVNAGKDSSFYITEPSVTSEDSAAEFINGGKNRLSGFRTTKSTYANKNELKSASISIQQPVSKNSNGMAMFYDTDNTSYFVLPESHSSTIRAKSSGSLRNTIKPCIDRYAKYSLYTDELKQYKVGVDYDASYTKTIKDFTACVNERDSSVGVGYTFLFVGLNPVDGRFVTN